MARTHSPALLDQDVRAADLAREMASWSFEFQCEVQELLLVSKRTIATSKTLIAEADRILARK